MLYNHTIEDWWRHLGALDREQVSGIPYSASDDSFLQKTDDWWEALPDEKKLETYEEFFDEN